MTDGDKDRIEVKPEDVLTGRELEKTSSVLPITDGEIRGILKRFAPLLTRAIENSDRFFSISHFKSLNDCVPIDGEERTYWDGFLGATRKVYRLAEEGKLFVPDLTNEELKMLEDSSRNNAPESISTTIRPKGESGRFRVNLDSPVWVPIQPFEPKDFKFMLKINPHFGGQGEEKGSLYNVFIAEDLLLQDQNGRWVVQYIEGTGVAPWMEGPVYGVHSIASEHVWFNESIKPERPNRWKVQYDHPDDLMMGIDIHHPEKLDELEIPDDPRQRFFFWQLQRFLVNPRLTANARKMLQEGD